MKETNPKYGILCILAGFILTLFTGCSSKGHYVVAASNTLIGVKVAQNPGTQFPEGEVGYARQELALVPTDRMQPDNEPRSEVYAVEYNDKGKITKETRTVNANGLGKIEGSDKSTDVLMELKATSLLSFNASIYQRLAVGKNAVGQPGAALMFSRDESGNTNPEAVKAAFDEIAKKTETIPLTEQGILNMYRAALIANEDTDPEAAAILSKVNKVNIIPDNTKIKIYKYDDNAMPDHELKYTEKDESSLRSNSIDYANSVRYIGDLTSSIRNLNAALDAVSGGQKVQLIAPAPDGGEIDAGKSIKLIEERNRQVELLDSARKSMRENSAVIEMVRYLEKSESS
ncbi:hypothetical protein [Cerasicoccus frondis]|uniref:hypothetical protein n=1 Tax=Cerasicoccus frondis TaxID=490090 RepID=UPI002852D92E|nr:hypothetical protein [Cerasicoccus frondis]